MIRELRANHDEFQTIQFTRGLNVLLAEKDPKATRQHSRNARGKTTVIQAINFCLAGNLQDPMKPLALDDWEFTLVIDLAGTQVSVSRSLSHPSSVRLGWAGPTPGILRPFMSGPGEIPLADWKLVCGLVLFGLDLSPEASANLSVRTLLSYILRVDATKDPIKILPQQSGVSAREHISYFLGLDWSLPTELERIRKSEEALKGLQYIASEQLLSGLPSEEELLLTLADLGHKRATLEDRVRKFTVVDDRDGLVFQADSLTQQLLELRDASFVDRRLISMYLESMNVDEQGRLEVADVVNLFEDVGLTFTSAAGNSLESVQAFHRALEGNRRRYVETELSSLRREDAERTAEIARIEAERARILRVLASSGAIEELIELQHALSAVVAEQSQASSALATLRESKQRRQELRLQKAGVRNAVSQDVALHQGELDELSSIFSGLLQRLYGKGGVISTDVDDYGQRFKISVDTAASSGVSKMKMLCFDLALMEFSSRRGRHPGFLVHDSFVFEGVDSRQVTEALKMIGEVTEATGAQYVCTLNSDAVVNDARSYAWFQNSIRREVMDTEIGGFLGVLF